MPKCQRCQALHMSAGCDKAVSSICVEHTGSRLVTGSRDYTVQLFDFNGMKSDMRSFRKVEPHEGHPVHAVSFSPTGYTLSHIILACIPTSLA
jgi:WD40 repeat protein